MAATYAWSNYVITSPFHTRSHRSTTLFLSCFCKYPSTTMLYCVSYLYPAITFFVHTSLGWCTPLHVTVIAPVASNPAASRIAAWRRMASFSRPDSQNTERPEHNPLVLYSMNVPTLDLKTCSLHHSTATAPTIIMRLLQLEEDSDIGLVEFIGKEVLPYTIPCKPGMGELNSATPIWVTWQPIGYFAKVAGSKEDGRSKSCLLRPTFSSLMPNGRPLASRHLWQLPSRSVAASV